MADLGVDSIKYRIAQIRATGGRILEVPSIDGAVKTDCLANKLRSVLADRVAVSRPVKIAEIRKTGLDRVI